MTWRKLRTGLMWTALFAALIALRLSLTLSPGSGAPAALIRLFTGAPADHA